jgi:hypothetical protein
MSFIHLEKSILTFHFKEILEDRGQVNPLALLGLGALIVGSKLATQPSPGRSLYGTTAIPLRQWVATAQKRELTQQLHTLVHPSRAAEPSSFPFQP